MFENQFQEKNSKLISWMSIYCSFSIFLFSAIALVVPSGFSYGALLLVLGSLVLLRLRFRFFFQRHDWIFVLTFVGYALINVLLNVYHGLLGNAYDKPLRYLLVIPVYFFLISCPPKQSYFWLGLIFGSLGAISIAIYQQFFDSWVIIGGRSTGFLNAIQFGDIAVLLAGLLLTGILYIYHSKKQIFVLIFFSAMALITSFLSFSRGGWLALPVVFYVLYIGADAQVRKKITLCACLFFTITIIIFFLLPESNLLKIRITTTASEVSTYLRHDINENTSTSTRIEMWKNGIEAFKARPILGWGNLDSIMSAFPSQWEKLKLLDDFNHLHNEYIDVLAKKGLVGFIVLMATYLVPLCYFADLMRTRQADTMHFAAAGIVLILCVMIFGLTQCFLAHNSGTMVFVFYLVIIKAYCRNIILSRNLKD